MHAISRTHVLKTEQVDSIRLPDQAMCLRLIRETEMLDNIVFHSIQVARVAMGLTDLLGYAGFPLNRNLVLTGAVLHDITKTRSITTKERHDSTGKKLLVEKGFPETGNIVGQHVRVDPHIDPSVVTESEIVNYADKRVVHDTVVPLDERMAYILERYGKTPAHCSRIKEMWREAETIEQKIWRRIPEEFLPVLEDCIKKPLQDDIETEMERLFQPESDILLLIKN